MDKAEDLFAESMVDIGSVGGNESSKAMTLKKGFV